MSASREVRAAPASTDSTAETHSPHDVGSGATADRVLYTYFRSSAAYRVRIALHLKGLGWQAVPVHLLREGGVQRHPAYTAINPLQLVPSYVTAGQVISQSLAICEYLDECHPSPPLLPVDALDRARVRQWALTIACDIHPLNNLRVLQYLEGPLALSAEQKTGWIRHWTEVGLAALEQSITATVPAARFCFGDTPTLADCCLVPQLFNARRFGVAVERYPRLVAIEAACEVLPAFQAAHPARQHDAT